MVKSGNIYHTRKEKSLKMNSTEVQNPRRKLDVFGSVLACAKSDHVFQKLSYSLCRLVLHCGHTFLRCIDLIYGIALWA